ncbi:MAG: multicopper oxidase domain-containing protein [Rhodobacteraceae bacterium]|nr:multicopper oxidase domain-containing protein [Paracoccaceae bacterium]
MLKFFGIVGLVGTVGVGYLVTYGVGPERQLPPAVSLLEGFREEGSVPENRNLPDDHSAEDSGAFEVPEEDGVYLEAALENMGDMSGMDMSDADAGSMEGMDMSTNEADSMEGMDMANSEDAVLDMDMDGDGVMDMGSADMNAGNMDGMNMAGSEDTGEMAGMDMSGSESTPEMADMAMSPSSAALMGEGGLLITGEGEFDRTIDLTMTEWGYNQMDIEVKVGERIKFVIANEGEILHEFMFMTGPLMAAANYRITRADWSLLEHEALFEKALMLPGGSFEIVVEIKEAGSWMFMCMLPYHMQMGMMGQMSTPGMAMAM